MKGKYYLVDTDGEVVRETEEDDVITIRSRLQVEYDLERRKREPVTINDGDLFYKSYRQLNLVRLFSGDTTCYLVLCLFANFIDCHNNCVIKLGRKYTITDASIDLGLSRKTISRCVNKLISMGLVKKVMSDKGSVFCLNPYYFCKGNTIPKNILNKFSIKLNETLDNDNE